jgi:alkylhydroperoxidase family enzyme
MIGRVDADVEVFDHSYCVIQHLALLRTLAVSVRWFQNRGSYSMSIVELRPELRLRGGVGLIDLVIN